VVSELSVCLQLAQLIVNAGGVAAMVDYVSDTCSNVRLPGIMMLGYVAAHSENLAMAVIVSKVGSFAFFSYKFDQMYNIYFDVTTGLETRAMELT